LGKVRGRWLEVARWLDLSLSRSRTTRYRGRFWTVKSPNVKRLSLPNNNIRTEQLLKHRVSKNGKGLGETLPFHNNPSRFSVTANARFPLVTLKRSGIVATAAIELSRNARLICFVIDCRDAIVSPPTTRVGRDDAAIKNGKGL